jgi:phage baseplate assembly protein W
MSAAEADNAFLGVGWGFPVARTQDGDIRMARHEESIREAIWLILATAPGERVMRPDFGCGLHDLVFSVDDATTSARAGAEVRSGLTRWEPRIEVLGVETRSSEDTVGMLLIAIRYRVRATNNVFNLVYPFYLDRGVPS